MSNLSFLDLFQELKAVGEFARFAGRAWTWQRAPRVAHPRPILLIPGFLAGDATLYPFANWLRARGHQVFFSGILANADCPRRVMPRLERILQRLFGRYGERLVVIGHSLGGIYARELARRMPECVEQTVLLGAPIREPGSNAHPFVKMLATLTLRLHETARGCSGGGLHDVCGIHSAETPPDVPETIIFSKSDGVVGWESCLESAPNVRSFEVDSTHVGLPYNLDTLRIVQELIESEPDVRVRA
jgi:pimeloyl-ACP methyl ester carboxylesterase